VELPLSELEQPTKTMSKLAAANKYSVRITVSLEQSPQSDLRAHQCNLPRIPAGRLQSLLAQSHPNFQLIEDADSAASRTRNVHDEQCRRNHENVTLI
jgi:hypothetical protein